VPKAYPGVGGALPPNIASIMLILIYKCHSEAQSSANGHSSKVESSTLKPAIRERSRDRCLRLMKLYQNWPKFFFINEDKVELNAEDLKSPCMLEAPGFEGVKKIVRFLKC